MTSSLLDTLCSLQEHIWQVLNFIIYQMICSITFLNKGEKYMGIDLRNILLNTLTCNQNVFKYSRNKKPAGRWLGC